MDSTEKALETIAPYVVRTPLVKSIELSKSLDCELYYKYEHLQTAGSVKARGAFLKLLSAGDGEMPEGFVTASSGNHGLSLALAAKQAGAKFKLFMPETTPPSKIEKVKAVGVDLVLGGTSWDDANDAALAHAKTSGFKYVHAFDDDTLVLGHSTAALECLQDQPHFDVAICSIGGGGIAKGFLGYLKSRLPDVRCYGVETYGAESMLTSFQHDKIMTLPAITSKASGIGVRAPVKSTFDFARQNLEGLVAVSDHASALAQRAILDGDKQLVELAASCCIAALQAGKIPDIKGKKVLVLLCGGNVISSELGLENTAAPKEPVFLPNRIRAQASFNP